jgi:hypothetical protein
MRRKIIRVFAFMILMACCSGASCRQETAQQVLETFLTELASGVANEIVTSRAGS